MDLLQIATGITKCDDYYKLRQYSVIGVFYVHWLPRTRGSTEFIVE